MSKPYTFRIDKIDKYTEKEIEALITKAVSKYTKFIIGKEITNKLHWQGIIWSDQAHDTYQKYMERHFSDWKGTKYHKGLRSFAQVQKQQNYQIYITKEGSYTHVLGYTDDEIEDLNKQSYKKKDIKINLPESDTGSEKLNKLICLQIFEFIKKHYLKPSDLSLIDVALAIRTFYGLQHKSINTYLLRSYADTIYISLGEHRQRIRAARLFNATLPDCLQEEDLRQYDCTDPVYEWDPIEKENLNI